MSAEHTPTPWVMEEQWSGIAIKSSEPKFTTLFKTQRATITAFADAEYIVRAANHHEELVAALEATIQLIILHLDGKFDPNGNIESTYIDAQTALTKARRGES